MAAIHRSAVPSAIPTHRYPPHGHLNSLYRTMARGAGIGLFGRLGGKWVHFIGMVLLARTLGVEAFGRLAVGWAVLRMAWIVLPLWTDRAVIAFGTTPGLRDQRGLRSFFLRVIGIAVLSGVTAAVGLYALSTDIARLFGDPRLATVFRALAPAIPFAAGLFVAAAATQVSYRIGFTVSGSELLQPFLFTTGVAIMMASGGLTLARTLYWLDGSLAIAFGVTLGFVLWLFRGPLFTPLPGVSWLRFMRYAVRVSTARLLFIPMMLSDRLFAGFFGTGLDTGLYNTAVQVAMVFALVTSGFHFILAPAFSELHTRRETSALTRVFHQGRRWMIHLTLPAGIILWVMPATVLSVLFGAEYAGAANILRILVLLQAINLFTGPAGMLLTMARKERQWLTAVLGGAGIYGIGIPIFGRMWGVTGVAAVYGLAMSTVYLMARWRVRRDLGVGPDRGLWQTVAVRSGVMVALVLGARAWTGVHTAVELIALAAGCYAVHFLLSGLSLNRWRYRFKLDHHRVP